MNENYQTSIEKFAIRVRNLMEAYKKQAENIAVLEQQKNELLQTIHQLKSQNELLSEVRNTQTTANMFSTIDGGSEIAKERIDRIVQEIDKCISSLDD